MVRPVEDDSLLEQAPMESLWARVFWEARLLLGFLVVPEFQLVIKICRIIRGALIFVKMVNHANFRKDHGKNFDEAIVTEQNPPINRELVLFDPQLNTSRNSIALTISSMETDSLTPTPDHNFICPLAHNLTHLFGQKNQPHNFPHR